MTAEVDIFRLAMAHLDDRPIASADDDTTQARLCRAHYDGCRDAVLRAHPWNVAMRRVQLAPLTDDPPFEWTYQFQLPADCLRLLPVTEDGAEDGRPVPYNLEGRRILADVQPLKIRYVTRLTDPGAFDPLLTQAIAAHLAMTIAGAITGKRTVAQAAAEMYRVKLIEARRVDGLEGGIAQPRADRWLEARF